MAINVDGIRPGEPIRAGWLNQLVRQLVSFFVAGRGIAIRMIGGKVMIECTLPDVRGRRGGGGLSIDEVTELPQVPESGMRIVHWLNSENGGTGDNQLWYAHYTYTSWKPMLDITSQSGTP